MKTTAKRFFSLFLALLLMIPLASCGEAVKSVDFADKLEGNKQTQRSEDTVRVPAETDTETTQAPESTETSADSVPPETNIPAESEKPENTAAVTEKDPEEDRPVITGSKGLEYTLSANGKYYILSGMGSCTDTDIIVANTYNGKPVKEVGDGAFDGRGDIHFTIQLPEGITRIGKKAFYCCIGLDKINIPSTVTEIDDEAFNSCGLLREVTIPEGVKRIGASAYEFCGTDSISISSTVAEIGKKAFYNIPHLEKITVEKGNRVYLSSGNCLIEIANKKLILGGPNSVIPSDGSVTIIADNAICGYGIKSIEFPSSIKEIGNNAIYSWNLESITFKGDAPKIADDAFFGLGATVYYDGNKNGWSADVRKNYGGELTWVNTSSTTSASPLQYTLSSDGKYYIVTGIGTCKDSKVVIPSTYNGKPVREIGKKAFNWGSFSEISIPSSITTIGDYAFGDCVKLKSITIPASVTKLGKNIVSGCEMDSITVASGNTVYHSKNNCVIETATKTLLFGCRKSTIPSDGSVTKIGEYAFRLVTFSSITIPNNVVTIGEWSFVGCANLKSIVIPEGVKTIGEYAFYSCTALSSIQISSTVTSIGKGAVTECAFTSIKVASGNKYYKVAGNCLIEISTKTLVVACTNGAVIPSDGSVTTIAESAFSNQKLAVIIIPTSITKIEKWAFYKVGDSVSITFKGNAPTIDSEAFKLTSGRVYYPKSKTGWNTAANKNYGGTLSWIAN